MTRQLVHRSQGPPGAGLRLLHRHGRKRMIAARMHRVLTSPICAVMVIVCASVGFAQRLTAAPIDTHSAATAQEADTPPPPQASKRAPQHVTGKVLDRDGQPVDRAEVRFDGPKKDKVWTDARGDFSFTGPGGDYVVTVRAGDRQQNFNVTIEDNQLKPSTLVIEPEPFN
jgi:hypothetical protein